MGDPLPQRKFLCLAGNEYALGKHEQVQYVNGVYVETVEKTEDGRISLSLLNRETMELSQLVVDTIVSNCGFRPDMDISRELQVHYCYASEGPMKLAATLLGASGDCLKQSVGAAD